MFAGFICSKACLYYNKTKMTMALTKASRCGFLLFLPLTTPILTSSGF